MSIHVRPPRTGRKLIRVSVADRARLERAIEDAIAFLDAVDPDPDIEENGDLEPSLAGAPAIDAAYDAELDAADFEDGGDEEPDLGWSNPLAPRFNLAGILNVERVPDRRVRRAAGKGSAVRP